MPTRRPRAVDAGGRAADGPTGATGGDSTRLLAWKAPGGTVRYLVEEKRHLRHQDVAVVADQLLGLRAALPRGRARDRLLLLAPHVRPAAGDSSRTCRHRLPRPRRQRASDGARPLRARGRPQADPAAGSCRPRAEGLDQGRHDPAHPAGPRRRSVPRPGGAGGCRARDGRRLRDQSDDTRIPGAAEERPRDPRASGTRGALGAGLRRDTASEARGTTVSGPRGD